METANVYISTNSGGEKFAASVAGGRLQTATITRALPATSAASTPTSNLTGVFIAGQAAPNTLFLAHTAPTGGNRPSIPGTVADIPANLVTIHGNRRRRARQPDGHRVRRCRTLSGNSDSEIYRPADDFPRYVLPASTPGSNQRRSRAKPPSSAEQTVVS